MPVPIIPIAIAGAVALLALSSRKASASTTKPPKPTTPGTGGGISGLGCPTGAVDGGIALLPVEPVDYRTPVQAAVAVPVAVSNPDALDALAAQLASCGQSKAANEVAARAKVVRDSGGGLVLPDLPPATPPVGGAGDVASPPDFNWRYVTQADDNATKIVARFFGRGDARNDAGIYRYVELIDRNVAANGSVGDRNNPNTKTDAAPYGYNFKRLTPGDRLFIPQSWNAWVTPDGKFKGGPSPYPTSL